MTRSRLPRRRGVFRARRLREADAMARLLEMIPLARPGTIEEVVHALMFLCSPACGYVTGQVIHVNGGLLMA